MPADRKEPEAAAILPIDPAVHRAPWIAITVALGCLGGFALSPRLWLTSRDYPLSPVSTSLPQIAAPWDAICFGALAALLVGAIVILALIRLGRARGAIGSAVLGAFVALAGLYSLWDQSRWQPWFYQYLFMCLALAFLSWGKPESVPGRSAASLNACRLIVAAIYFWSGLQKLNPLFFDDVHPWLIEPILKEVPDALHGMLLKAGCLAPIVEAGLGLGLLFRRTRPVAVAGIAVMHAMLLLVLGPWGHDWNTVVWPWNVAMPVLTALLFWNTRGLTACTIVRPRFASAHALILVLFAIMPLLNFFNMWDSYLSAALYSGNVLDGHVVIVDSVHQQLTPAVQSQFQFVPDEGDFRMRISDWSMKELNVPAYPARRVFRSVARQLATTAKHPLDAGLIIQERPKGWSKERDLTFYDAVQLGVLQP